MANAQTQEMYFPVNPDEVGVPCVIVWPEGKVSIAEPGHVPRNCIRWRCAKRRPRIPAKITPDKNRPMAFITVDVDNTAPMLLTEALNKINGIGVF